MDGLNDAQNAVLDEYFPNNGPKTSSECRFIDIFWKAWMDSNDIICGDVYQWIWNTYCELQMIINKVLKLRNKFFLLPSDIISLTTELAQKVIANKMQTGIAPVMAMNVGSLYAPINSFEFNRVDYSQIKIFHD